MASLTNPITADGSYTVNVLRGKLYSADLIGEVGSALVNLYSVDNAGNPGSFIGQEIDSHYKSSFQTLNEKIVVEVIGANSATNFTLRILPVQVPVDDEVIASSMQPGAGVPVKVTGFTSPVELASGTKVVSLTDIVTLTATLTRPSDTTAYASGDLVANSTTAGSVVFPNASANCPILRRLIFTKSGTSITNASFRIHIFAQSPTTGGGDNATFSVTKEGYLGAFDVTVDRAFSNGACGVGVPITGTEILNPNFGALYFIVEARGAYTPASGETFTLAFQALLGA